MEIREGFNGKALILALLAVAAWLYLVLALADPNTFGTWDDKLTVFLSMSAEAILLLTMTGLLIGADRDGRPAFEAAHIHTFL